MTIICDEEERKLWNGLQEIRRTAAWLQRELTRGGI